MMQELDDEAAQIEKVCVELEGEEKMEEIGDNPEGIDEDLYTGSRIVRQPPPTVYNAKKMCKKQTSNLVDWTKFLTEEAK